MDIYLVGGAVRDQLLGLSVKDKDWVVVGSTPQAMLDLGYRQVGADFPVFLHPETQEEFALARTERKSAVGYQGFECQFASDVTLEQDLLRRDLTINAMAQNAHGDIIDPYNGQQDLHHKILRHVSPAFIEDPLRVLRVARFAARFDHLGFKVADETLELMREIVATGEIQHLVAERVFQESHRAISEQNPERYFIELNRCHALQHWFPEWQIFAPQFRCPSQNTETLHRWGAYLSCFSKEQIQQASVRIKLPNQIQELANCAVDLIQAQTRLEKPNAAQLIKLLNEGDAWRRSDRWLNALAISLERITSPIQLVTWQKWLHQLKAINAQQIVAQGFRGPEVGQQLEKLRQTHLEELIKSEIS